MAYGSPNSMDDVEDYMIQIRGGRKPTEAEVELLRERYRQVGGRTPLLQITQSQARALQQRLRSDGLDIPIYMGMKHWHPFIEETVQQIVRDGATSLVGVALAPHYSKLSIGGYEEAVRKGLQKNGSTIPFAMVKSWYREDSLLRALSRRVEDGLGKLTSPREAAVLFTAHSLPKRKVAPDDPYQNQLLETSQLVAKQIEINFWSFAFQSAGRPEEDWLGPGVRDQVLRLSKEGFHEVLVCPVGFVSDHLEILYDLDIDAKQYATLLGVRLERTCSLNDDPDLIDALANVSRQAMEPKTLLA
jgi:ferrochelatase